MKRSGTLECERDRVQCGNRDLIIAHVGQGGFQRGKHCLELSYVGLNALMVADCEILEKMAALLGRKKREKSWKQGERAWRIKSTRSYGMKRQDVI